MNSQTAILKDALDLLGNLLKEWSSRKSYSDGKDIRRSYINRHAWNIHELGSDVLVLTAAGKLGSIYLLSRPALESLFKLAAAVVDKDFAAQKVVAEVEEDSDKVRHWLAAASPNWIPTLNKMITLLHDFGDDLRKRYGVTGQRKWKTYEVAKTGNLEVEYVRDYFIGSKHVHAMLSALTARDEELYVPDALYRLTVAVAHASALVNKALMDLENCVAPAVFDNATEIMHRAKSEFDSVSAAQTAELRAQGF